MTNEEAIKELKKEFLGEWVSVREAKDFAISALEKQIPKDVWTDGYGWNECPECHNKRPNWLLGKDAKWCPYCGQRIRWEGDDKE